MLLGSSSDHSTKQTSAEPVKHAHWISGLRHGAARSKEVISSLSLPYTSVIYWAQGKRRRPAADALSTFDTKLPGERVKCTISFCFKASSVTLAKVALLSENLTAYFVFFIVKFIFISY